MKIPRLCCDHPLAADEAFELPPDTSHYVARVLRLRAGDRVVLFNGDGHDYAGQVTSADKRSVVIEVETRLPAAAESPLRTTLVQGISRGERMDLTLQKATELGVTAIQPVFTERVEVRLAGARLDKRMGHWRAVVRSACEQSGRGRIPSLAPPVALAEWAAAEPAADRVVLAPDADQHLSAWLPSRPQVELVVGPEGGLSPDEMRMLSGRGVAALRLGPRVLRTETAGPAALAVLQALAGDF